MKEFQESSWKFIISHGTLIIAIYGVVQVWIISFIKKFIIHGAVKIYETGNVEIGYSTYGPTIGLNGTLRGFNKDIFISSIDLLIVREKDKAEHTFRWVAFRPSKIDFTTGQNSQMEIPSGFMVSPDSPHRFNITFNDTSLLEEIRPAFLKYYQAWNEIVKQINNLQRSPQKTDLPATLTEVQLQLIESFRKSPDDLELYNILCDKFYWEDGSYLLKINVRSSKPDKAFSNKYKFSLTVSDSKSLKLNSITMLNEPISLFLGSKNFPYNFAYAEYKL